MPTIIAYEWDEVSNKAPAGWKIGFVQQEMRSINEF